MVDAALVSAALAGGLVGGACGLVPGAHPNTLAAGALAVHARGSLPPQATTVFLLGALGAWTFTTAIPLVVLGVPEGEHAPALLPGQRLARQGHADLALSASATGSLVGLAVGIPAALALTHALSQPGASVLVQAATPWVAACALLVLVLTDPSGLTRASVVVLAAGVLGVIALEATVASPLGLPATPLMPLFIGLYGLPALAHAAESTPPSKRFAPLPERAPLGPGRRGPLIGAGLGLVSGLFSGFTSGPATAVAAILGRSRATSLMATTSAVNTATVCSATGVLHALQRTRTGVHAAQLALAWPAPGWDAVLGDLAAASAGGLVGVAMLAVARGHAHALAQRVPGWAKGLIAPWIASIYAFTGWVGGLVCLASWVTARAAHAAAARC